MDFMENTLTTSARLEETPAGNMPKVKKVFVRTSYFSNAYFCLSHEVIDVYKVFSLCYEVELFRYKYLPQNLKADRDNFYY